MPRRQGPRVAPLRDFAVWGPHGQSIARWLKFKGVRLESDGSISSVEIAGRARLELSERLRRVGEEDHARATTAGGRSAFNPDKPWECVWCEL